MQTITPAELKQKLRAPKNPFYLIDVREIEEFEAGHLPGALFMPWHTIEEKIKGIDKQRELILYCRTGVRAIKAAKLLEKLGFANLTIYREGWEGWNKDS